jgi:hypothetical protein
MKRRPMPSKPWACGSSASRRLREPRRSDAAFAVVAGAVGVLAALGAVDLKSLRGLRPPEQLAALPTCGHLDSVRPIATIGCVALASLRAVPLTPVCRDERPVAVGAGPLVGGFQTLNVPISFFLRGFGVPVFFATARSGGPSQRRNGSSPGHGRLGARGQPPRRSLRTNGAKGSIPTLPYRWIGWRRLRQEGRRFGLPHSHPYSGQ